MSETVDKLFALQQLQFGTESKDSWSRMARLRKSIPADVLSKYDRLATRVKKPVALVRNGVCSQCHIRLAVGVMFEVTQGHTVICDSCGRILHGSAPATEESAAKTA